MDYDGARRQAAAYIDAYNRRDMDAYMAQFHEEITHQSAYVDARLGQEDGRIDGKQAFGEYVNWLLEQDPAGRDCLEEVFTGPQGYAFVTRRELDGRKLIFVREVGADGLVRNQRVYGVRPPAD